MVRVRVGVRVRVSVVNRVINRIRIRVRITNRARARAYSAGIPLLQAMPVLSLLPDLGLQACFALLWHPGQGQGQVGGRAGVRLAGRHGCWVGLGLDRVARVCRALRLGTVRLGHGPPITHAITHSRRANQLSAKMGLRKGPRRGEGGCHTLCQV